MRKKKLVLIFVPLLLGVGLVLFFAFSTTVRYYMGKYSAHRDLAAGVLRLEVYGEYSPWEDEEAGILKTRYGIERKWVAGCILSDSVLAHADGYNTPMLREIDRRFGEGVTEKIYREAKLKYEINLNDGGDWPPNTLISELLSEVANGSPTQLHKFVDASPLRATDSTFTCVILIRDHDAWLSSGEWHDANIAVRKGGQGLQMINYYDRGFWSKLPVPQDSRIKSVRWEGSHFVFETPSGPIQSTPAQIKAAVLDSMTGRGLSDQNIAHNFGKLDGSVPLDYP